MLNSNFQDDLETPQWGNEYSGTLCTIERINMVSGAPAFWIVIPFIFIDTIFSFTGETIMYPIEYFADDPEHGYEDCSNFHM